MSCSRIEIGLLVIPVRPLRIGLTVIMLIIATALPPWLAAVALWLAALRYVPLFGTMVRIAHEHKTARLALVAERQERDSLLADHEARIATLMDPLADAWSSRAHPDDSKQRIHRRVGLHPEAPDWLIAAARRAYRSHLHPDRHPRHHQQAHERYLRAEAAFDEIAALRRK